MVLFILIQIHCLHFEWSTSARAMRFIDSFLVKTQSGVYNQYDKGTVIHKGIHLNDTQARSLLIFQLVIFLGKSY